MNPVDPAVAAARAIKENAKRLGLEWTLRQGTVGTPGPTLRVRLDGPDVDTQHQVFNLLDGVPPPGTRVMVLMLPDAMYIVGRIGGHGKSLTNLIGASANSDLTLTTTATLVPNCTITITVDSPAQWKVDGTFDFDMTVAASTVAQGFLYVDGVAQTEQALFELALTSDRATVGQQWTNTFTASGDHTLELRAAKSANVGTALARTSHTSFVVATYE